jgi:hypothetical protein
VAGFAAIASALLALLGIFAIVIGVIFCLTVVGAIIGIPLMLLGALALVGGAIGGSGGIFFALLLGAGIGYLYYRQRLRKLTSAIRAS